MRHSTFPLLRHLRHSAAALALLACAAAACASESTPLHDDWQLQSSCKVQSNGAAISMVDYAPTGWIHHVSVPSTVLAAQVAAKEVKDPMYGKNLRDIPGTTYAIGANFANSNIDPKSPYHCSWWYRKNFAVPASAQGKTLWLHFRGMNYRANLWINGKQVADDKHFVGAFTTFTFDITKYVTPGKENAVAVETFAPEGDDLAMTWVDWSPMPPDKEMGLWAGVDLITSGPVAIDAPAVTTHFPTASLKEADLTVYANLRNSSDKTILGTLSASLEGLHLEQMVAIGPGETRTVAFSPNDFTALRIQNPKLWWPWQMGQPNLETLQLSFATDGKVSDTLTTKYGIREITAEMIDRSTKGSDIIPAKPAEVAPAPQSRAAATGGGTGAPNANNAANQRQEKPQQTFVLYRVNGKPILIRGGGWAPDMMLREDPVKLRAQFRMVRDLGLNTIRSEGKMENEDFFHLADEQGILVMIGWSCCDRWERQVTRANNRPNVNPNAPARPPAPGWSEENHEVALTSIDSQILRLRIHPSILVWLNGSDNPPSAPVEQMYIDEEAKLHWPNPTLSSATARRTTVTGESGVKMNGPYDYVTPGYWLTDEKYGGAWGFSTEIGPGPAIPPVESLKKFLPESSFWPHDDTWMFHAGGGGFKTTKNFDDAMNNIYGTPHNAVEYDHLAQAMAYDGQRAMFEGYSRNKYNSTGVIQWMLNNSWPSIIWHLYDYYLGAGGGYYGTKKADEPLHVQYGYDDHGVWVVNSTYTAPVQVTASVNVYDANMKKLFTGSSSLSSTPDSSLKAISIPDSVWTSGPSVFFVEMQLKNSAGAVLSRNFYWVPAKLSTYDFSKTRYTTSPIANYEDMTAIEKLPPAKITATAHIANGKAIIELHNPSTSLAFQVAVSTDAAESLTNAPVLWSDNYVSLLPGESATLSATLPAGAKTDPTFHVAGWNTPEMTLHAVAAK